MKLSSLLNSTLKEKTHTSKWAGKTQIPVHYEDKVFTITLDVPFPGTFADQDDFEDFILDHDLNETFGEIKDIVGEYEGLDIDDESEEQDANEITWQTIYQACDVPYEYHYNSDHYSTDPNI